MVGVDFVQHGPHARPHWPCSVCWRCSPSTSGLPTHPSGNTCACR
jgi:hypothetical protein